MKIKPSLVKKSLSGKISKEEYKEKLNLQIQEELPKNIGKYAGFKYYPPSLDNLPDEEAPIKIPLDIEVGILKEENGIYSIGNVQIPLYAIKKVFYRKWDNCLFLTLNSTFEKNVKLANLYSD